jgi:branched-chain amino acid transport system ATP-binding protein
MPDEALTLVGLRKAFGSLEIIRGVDLHIRESERHAIIGPNGAGKSTLFNLISGLLKPSGGEVRLGQRRISGLSPYEINRLGLSRSFQITNIFPRLSVFENLRLGIMGRHGIRYGLFQPISRLKSVNQETGELVDSLRLTSRADHPAGELSYSEQRALEIGMTLATNPSIILLDEPTAGMSREETEYVVALIERVTAGHTLLIVEHDMGVVFGLCDRISVLVYGRILATGTPDEIRTNAEVQRAYLGEEAA